MKKRILLGVGAFNAGLLKMAAQIDKDPIGQVNSQLKTQYSSIYDLASTILLILLVLSFIFMIINFIFNVTDNKKSITTFLVTLLLYGLFKVIFSATLG